MRAHAMGARGALVGALVGAVASAAVWIAERSAIAGGADAAGLGFGDSHLLFFLSLPWSLAVAAAGALATTLGAHGLSVHLVFFAMPVAAGAGWGWIAGRAVRRWRPSAAPRPPDRRST